MISYAVSISVAFSSAGINILKIIISSSKINISFQIRTSYTLTYMHGVGRLNYISIVFDQTCRMWLSISLIWWRWCILSIRGTMRRKIHESYASIIIRACLFTLLYILERWINSVKIIFMTVWVSFTLSYFFSVWYISVCFIGNWWSVIGIRNRNHFNVTILSSHSFLAAYQNVNFRKRTLFLGNWCSKSEEVRVWSLCSWRHHKLICWRISPPGCSVCSRI